MRCLLFSTAAIAVLAAVPALAQTMGTNPSVTAPTAKSSPCMSKGAPPTPNIDRSGTGSGGSKTGTTSSSGGTAGTSALSNSGSANAPHTASNGAAC